MSPNNLKFITAGGLQLVLKPVSKLSGTLLGMGTGPSLCQPVVLEKHNIVTGG